MNEIEVKILDINKDDIIQKLKKFGAKKVFDDEINAIYLDYEDKRLVKNKNVLRLRTEGKTNVLTMKEFVSKKDVKIFKEYELTVSDFKETQRIFEMLGIKKYTSMKKHRTSYKLDNIKFEFDKYENEYDYIPLFLEIECEDKEKIFEYAKKLGFSKKQCTPYTFIDLVKIYEKV